MTDAQSTAAAAGFCLLLVAVGGCDDGPTPPRPLVLSVEVAPEVLTLVEGDTADLNAVVTTEGGASRAVRWSSTRDSVATVDSAGTVTAREEGHTTLFATAVADTTKKDSAQLTVKKPLPCLADLANLTVSPSEATVAVGETVDFDAEVPMRDTAESIGWTSGDTAVATVDSSGTARGESAGSTTIAVEVDYPRNVACDQAEKATLDVVSN